jgi:hypothetical protein
VAATPERPGRRDPLEEERERARGSAEGTQLPSERGQGPGAGETPVADVEVDPEAAPEDVPTHPSLGAPPRREESRPVFRSSQLQDGESEKSENGHRLRG